ncbi:hypothetical protein [Mycobacterium sp. 852002-40037_SCH5390672]|uniref:hypothetical protein n=1 Tax=Mycobacterium sp. 852002-40037_SCH5390672 TaxID=1834089 RepID=UPI000805ED70|nr:hypothetical protein [Mycobacterium sp. 852002-40037_SCH5390672]OBB99766.1 hypothetical protein A5782_21745 [Mycobacterium sp. 852002-40037_SCH5390672]
MTYIEDQPPVIITRDEVRDIAECAWAVLNPNTNDDLSPMARAVLRKQLEKSAKNVLSWCDGTLLSGENDAYEVNHLVPMTFRVRGYYTKDLAEKLDLTPQTVLDANPIYVVMLQRLAEFIDGWFGDSPMYSTEARLEALGDYDRIMARLQNRTAEYVAEVAANPGDDEDESDDESNIERSTNHGVNN